MDPIDTGWRHSGTLMVAGFTETKKVHDTMNFLSLVILYRSLWNRDGTRGG